MGSTPDDRSEGDAGRDAHTEGRSLAVREMAWAALLGRWIEFAKASVSLPDDGTGGRWKRSVVPFIELQATVWALRELSEIGEDDRSVARDRAELTVRKANAALSEVWGSHPMPGSILELIDDATVALREAIYAGLREIVWEGEGPYEVPEVPGVDDGDAAPCGTLALMPPGSLAMPGEPIGWFTERPALALPGCVTRASRGATQVYREIDDAGRFVRDVVAPLEGDIPVGLPMLVARSIAGVAVRRPTHTRAEWFALQRGAIDAWGDGRTTIPVIRLDEAGGESA
jgi:hypothetical protein